MEDARYEYMYGAMKEINKESGLSYDQLRNAYDSVVRE